MHLMHCVIGSAIIAKNSAVSCVGLAILGVRLMWLSSYHLHSQNGKKGKTMSRYGDPDYDDMFYELDEFLKSHKPSELLKLVQEAVEWWEEKDDG